MSIYKQQSVSVHAYGENKTKENLEAKGSRRGGGEIICTELHNLTIYFATYPFNLELE